MWKLRHIARRVSGPLYVGTFKAPYHAVRALFLRHGWFACYSLSIAKEPIW